MGLEELAYIVNDCRWIADHYGEENQVYQLQEEAQELALAISKIRRHGDTARSEMFWEMADVMVMIMQVAYLTGDDVFRRMRSKINRQLQRIEREKDESTGSV